MLPIHLFLLISGNSYERLSWGKRNNFPSTTIFATIVMERIIDVFSLLILMVVIISIYPSPQWLLNSGYLMLACSVVLFSILVLLRCFQEDTLVWMKRLLKFGPDQIANKALQLIERFISGVSPLAKKCHYYYVAILSAAIWACYGMVYYLNIVAFQFDEMYHIPWYATLVILVVTTISVLIPSSPGYVGTFHYLCQLSLVLFGVNASEALSYATVVHAVNVLPVTIVGLVMANIEGVAIYRTQKMRQNENIIV